MALQFLNPTRSYDATRNCVRFWGHDGAHEASFFVEEAAFAKLDPGAGKGEATLLAMFDRNRDRIMTAASRVYARGRQNSYTVAASDF